ncbi:MAG: F0F1 ATP synthase subunit B [Peptococcaceae bacterium]|nr:F0F1 ATP synthase subunit B [Peptococcaceae bacterium]
MEILHIDATLIAQIVSFLILLAILSKFAYRPLLGALEKRSQYIEDNIKSAEQAKAEAQQIKIDFETELRQARVEAQAIIERASKAGEERGKEIIAESSAEADRLKKIALAEIELEKQKAMSELHDQVANLALLVAGKLVQNNLNMDPAAQGALVNQFVKEVGDLPC